MPKKLVAHTGMDAMTHAIEAYVSTLHCNYTDPLALHAIKMIHNNLKKSYDEAAKRYAEIASFIGLRGDSVEAKVSALIAELRAMNDQLDIPQSIQNYGKSGVKAETSVIDEKEFLEKLPEVAKNAIADACTGSNPRQPSQEEMEKLLKACYYDLEIDF